MYQAFQLFIRLLTAHLISDFVIQRDSWVDERDKYKLKSKWLWIHGSLAGILAYIFIGMWTVLWLPLVIAISHIIIDIVKSTKDENLYYFTIDQVAHLLIISTVWFFLAPSAFGETLQFLTEMISNTKVWVIVSAYIFVLWPAGVLIKKTTNNWKTDIENRSKGLEEAGLWIGRLERFLVLTFVILNQYGAIGFLIAAKSVFRFGEITKANNRKEAEYMLIGTMISFSIAIITGIIVYRL